MAMRVFIQDTKETKELSIIDPRTGVDWIGDFMEASKFEYDDDRDVYLISKDDFDWWSNFAERYEAADNAVYELVRDDSVLAEEYHDYIGGYEFNDLPSAMESFVEEHTTQEETTEESEVEETPVYQFTMKAVDGGEFDGYQYTAPSWMMASHIESGLCGANGCPKDGEYESIKSENPIYIFAGTEEEWLEAVKLGEVE